MILWPAHWLGPALTLVALLLQTCWVQGDADFESVRIHPEYRYMGGRGGDPKDKYWRRSTFPIMPLTSLKSRRRVDVSYLNAFLRGLILTKAKAFILTTMAGMPMPCFSWNLQVLTIPRFIDHTLPYEEQKTNLTLLMQSYLWTMADLGAETWIIHGTLLGWWWNRKVRPDNVSLPLPRIKQL